MRSLSDNAILSSRIVLAARRLALRTGNLAMAAASAPLPRFSLLASTVLAGSAAYGAYVGGHTRVVVDAVVLPAGFSIQNVEVVGNTETSEIDVLQALWGTGAQSLVSLDATEARRAIEMMPWIDRASVSKAYPDNVVIDVLEHRPYAVWQNGSNFVVIDREGREIVPYTPGRFEDLPVIVGTGAAERAAFLIDEMEVLPELRARVRAYILVANRRWDVRLENGVTIKLPEEGAVGALAEVARMDRENELLSRDIESVDMRLRDRMVVALTPEALERREAALEKREEIRKKRAKGNPA